ncbi:MAG: hypothetical protein HWD86_01470 [Kangiellaceae bacterium]|nr:hypothetical protein [Kangiellaceae bacterium]
MNKQELLDFDFSFVAAAIAGIISIAAVDTQFDLTDTAIGIILLLMMWPTFSLKKTLYLRLLVAVTIGMCLLLIFGVALEHFNSVYQLHWPHQAAHFLIWLLCSLLAFMLLHSKDKKI